MKSCIVAIAKDEAVYLKEWATYHLALGFNKIFLYDNDSSDHPETALAGLSEEIQIIKWPTQEDVSPQLSAYNNPNLNLRDEYDFVAFIDIDEFIVLKKHTSINDYLATVPDDISAIAVNQKIFGSSHIENYENLPVTLRFQRCAPSNHPEHLWFKSIYRTQRIKQINNCHNGDILTGLYGDGNFNSSNIDTTQKGMTLTNASSQIQINHYILKSREEFETKKKVRGGGMESTLAHRLKRYDNDYFFSYRDSYANDELDTAIVELIQTLQLHTGRNIHP